jgi:LysR family transcriptional regulator of beta-lactamase
MFDSPFLMAEAAARGHGVAILPVSMFEDDLASGRLVRPLDPAFHAGSYWLTTPQARERSAALTAFVEWMGQQASQSVQCELV